MANPPNNPRGRHSIRSPLKQVCYADAIARKPRFPRFFLLWLNRLPGLSAATLAHRFLLRDRCLPRRTQMLPDRVVALVDVRAELYGPTSPDKRGLVDQKH